MIPRTCANCEHCLLLEDDASQPVKALCSWAPQWHFVVDARVHYCAQFRMAPQPRYMLPDEQPQEGGQDVQVDAD